MYFTRYGPSTAFPRLRNNNERNICGSIQSDDCLWVLNCAYISECRGERGKPLSKHLLANCFLRHCARSDGFCIPKMDKIKKGPSFKRQATVEYSSLRYLKWWLFLAHGSMVGAPTMRDIKVFFHLLLSFFTLLNPEKTPCIKRGPEY